ncbi:MAG: hypothetical protein V2B17_03100 [Chloroflexota bacterium]
MMVNRRFLYLGVFLVAAGAVLLVGQGDAADREVMTQLLRLWPVAIIALGIGILLRRTRFGLAGGMLAAAMPGLLLGGLVVAAPRMPLDCGDARPASFVTREGTFDAAASVDLRLACGDLSVTMAPGTGWRLETGSGAGTVATVGVSAGRLSVASSSRARPFEFIRGGETWRLSLPVASRLDLAAEVNAGRGRFDMAGAQLGNVRLAVNAGDTRVDLSGATVAHLSMSVNAAAASLRLPDNQDVGADLSVNAGSLKVCAASDVGLRVRSNTVLGSTNYAGLVHNGDAWESPGYSMANHHADVTISVNVGSVDVNPVGGCQ